MSDSKEMITYFAYGSNMLTERIKERAEDASSLGIAHIDSKSLTFHKVGTRANGSKNGKCTIIDDKKPEAVVYGVLYEMPKVQFDDLNTHEEGYSVKEIDVYSTTLGKVKAQAHFADSIDANLIPYDWYKDLVLEGALQHGIPEKYIQENIQSMSVEATDSYYRTAREAKALIRRIRDKSNAATS